MVETYKVINQSGNNVSELENLFKIDVLQTHVAPIYT